MKDEWLKYQERIKELEKENSFLKENFRLQQALTSNANYGIIVYDTELRCQVWNPFMENLTGISAKEILGKYPPDFFPFLIENKTIDKLRDLLISGKSFHSEFFVEVESDTGWVNDFSSAISNEDNSITGIISIVTDITERKQAEIDLKKVKEKVEESEERFKLAMRAAKDGVYDWNLQTNEIYYSPGWKAILGYEDEELQNETSIWEKLTKPEDVARSREMQEDVINKQLERFELEIKMKHKNGYWVDILSRADVVFNDKGKALRVVGTHVDITERKRTEEKIRAAEENIKNTFNLSPSIIAKANLITGYFVEANQAVTKMLGYSVKEFTSRPISDFIHPEDIERTTEESEAEKNGKEITFFENRYLCKDGSYKWMAWHGTKADKDGIVTAIGSDINERKCVEEEIVKTKLFYENITECVQDGIWVTDKNDVISYANLAMEKIVGVPREQIQGNNVLKDFPKETTYEFNKFYRQAKKEKKPVWYDIQVKTPAKRDTWQNGWLIPQYHNDRFSGIICSIRDVTKRKLTENELIKAKEKAEENIILLKNITDNVPVYIGSVDVETLKYKFVNSKFLTSFNKKRDEIIGSHISEVIGKEYTAFAMNYIDEVRKGNSTSYIKTFDLAQGTRYINVKYVPGYNEAGVLTDVIVLSNDITDIKQSEIDLQKAKEKAEESDRLKTAFLQNMSHEIRTPMNAIMGFSGLLSRNFNDQAKLQKFSNIINRRCHDLLDIINDILDISKIESGQLPINLEECDLKELFNELYIFFVEYQNRIGKQHIDFEMNAFSDPENNLIITDSVKLKQVFINLISNAFKFTDEGSIKGGCRFDENKNPVFYVSDTGIGISLENRQLIYERFTQVHQGENLNTGGTGLGLPIVKGLVELLGGEIHLESELEKGSSFIFSFPYKTVKRLPTAQTPLKRSDLNHFFNKTILIVEDDLFNAELLKEILSGHGLNILFTESGKDAVEIAIKQSIDLILMDIRLPDLNGYEATRRIKLSKPQMMVIAQTAYAAQEEKQKAIEAGCVDYISKPTKREFLLEMINKYLSVGNEE